MENIRYEVGVRPNALEFVDLYRASPLGQYRPLDDMRGGKGSGASKGAGNGA